jgi:hypothetical protein
LPTHHRGSSMRKFTTQSLPEIQGINGRCKAMIA